MFEFALSAFQVSHLSYDAVQVCACGLYGSKVVLLSLEHKNISTCIL